MYNDYLKRDIYVTTNLLQIPRFSNKNINIRQRFNVDYVTQNNLNEEYAGMNRVGFDYVGGKYYNGDSRSSDIYNDHMLTWNDRFNDKIDVNVAVGTSFFTSLRS